MKIQAKKGFTIPELMVVMVITGILTGLLALFYSESRLTLQRGVIKTELQQRVRLASIRIVPKITSTIYRPATDTIPELNPIASPSETDPAGDEIILNCTEEFAQTQMRETVVEFNPRNPLYAQLRLKFRERSPAIDPENPELEEIGDLLMDRNTPGDQTDDIILASNLHSVTFKVLPGGNIVRLRVEANGYVPNATSGRSVQTESYETDIYLPVDTNSGGT